WLATAASLLLAVAIPLRMLPPAGGETSDTLSRHSGAGRSPAFAAEDSSQTQPLDPGIRRDDDSSTLAVDAQPVPTPAIARRDTPRRVPPSQRPIRTAATPDDATRVAATDASAAPDLEPLYAQSAQLESL